MWFKKENVVVVIPELREEVGVAPAIRRMEHTIERDDSLASPVLAEARELLGYDPHVVAGQVLREALSTYWY